MHYFIHSRIISKGEAEKVIRNLAGMGYQLSRTHGRQTHKLTSESYRISPYGTFNFRFIRGYLAFEDRPDGYWLDIAIKAHPQFVVLSISLMISIVTGLVYGIVMGPPDLIYLVLSLLLGYAAFSLAGTLFSLNRMKRSILGPVESSVTEFYK